VAIGREAADATKDDQEQDPRRAPCRRELHSLRRVQAGITSRRATPLTLLGRALRTFFSAILWTGLLGLVMPAADALLYRTRLLAMPAPSMLAPPLRTVKPAALRDSWHAGRSGGRRHEGIDIFAARGTPVHATTEGIVLRRGHNALGGKVVWVLGPGGQRHYYAHLDRFAPLAVGERVRPATVLGFAGNTGNASTTAPHLHYGVYERGGAINPYPLLARGSRESGLSWGVAGIRAAW
jgi:hypothetical protein